nr:reverse transcriptase domain-containing protein [Tanacetum cinerariifolium]
MVLGRIQRLSSGADDGGGRGEKDFLYRPGYIVLHEDAVWSKERKGNVPVFGRQSIQDPNRKKPRSMDQNEVKSEEMLIWSREGKVLRGNAKSDGEAGSTKSFPLPVDRKVFTFLRNIKRHYQGKQARLPMDRKGRKCIPRSQEDDFRPTGSNNALPERNFVCILSDIKRGSKCSAIVKMALALRHSSRRFRRYFEAHPITVITDQPIKQILSKADTSGQLAPYAVELGAYNITYEPCNAIKGQVLVDFINEIPVGSNAIAPLQSHYKIDQQKDYKKEWTLYTDGVASAKGSGAVVEKEGETWMTPIINGLERGTWSEDQNEARALRMKISQYVMEEGVLIKRSYLMPMIWYVGQLQANYVVREIHMGACSMNLKAILVVAKAIRQGVLHANDAPRRKRSNTQMRLIPDPLSNSKIAQNLDDINHGTLTILSIGNGLISAKINMPTHRTMMIKEGDDNEEEMKLNLDLLTEKREAAAIRKAKYKTKVEQYYNKKVRPMSFKVGDYVYRKNEASRVANLGKLGSKWGGPYLIVEAYQNGSYKLRTMDDREVPNV